MDGEDCVVLAAGCVVGELAIMYNCTRTASLIAVEDVKVSCMQSSKIV